MKILVYARNADLSDVQERVRDRHPDAELLPRHAPAHVEGQLESADLVLVDDRFPQVAEEYEDAGVEARVFDVFEPSSEPEPLPEDGHDPLLDLTVADLRETLPGIEDKGRLLGALEQEDRVTARDALEARIDELGG